MIATTKKRKAAPPARKKWDANAKRLRGPKTKTIYLVAAYYDGKFNSIVSVCTTLAQAEIFLGNNHYYTESNPWCNKIRKVTISWPERKGGAN